MSARLEFVALIFLMKDINKIGQDKKEKMYGRGRSEDMFNLCLNFNESQPSYANTRCGYRKRM